MTREIVRAPFGPSAPPMFATASCLRSPAKASHFDFPAKAATLVIPAKAGIHFDLCWESMKRQIHPATYMMASARRGTLYVGVTSNLVQRVWQHREHVVEGFSASYDVTMLVWYEMHGTMESAILREKSIKGWKRAWKFELIEERNSEWRDLWTEIVGSEGADSDDKDQNGFLLSQE